jgi:hypothetical protein
MKAKLRLDRHPEFEWDEEHGVAICMLSDGVNTFVGTSTCHPDDRDMMSEKTGCNIALIRAEIKYFKHVREYEIKPALNALYELYYNMKHSKQFNPKSYENKMLWRRIRAKEFDLDVINQLITTEKQNLSQMIDEKEKFYQRIRANRNKDKSN